MGERRNTGLLINKERLIEEFYSLLNINSPSRQEGALAEAVIHSLKDIGFRVQIDDAGKVMNGEVGNVVATLPGNPQGRKIYFCAHMDTVAPTDGMRVIQENGIIRQEGAAILGADDKAGIAAILEGVRSAVEAGETLGQIQAVILICEEIGLFGAKHLEMSLMDSELGYVFDSGQPVAHIVKSAPYHDNILAEFSGRSAHAGVCPEEGISAIQAAALAISEMRLGRIDLETTANVGIISGGSARNVIPEKCEIKAEARSRDEVKLNRQVEHMRLAMESAAARTGASVKMDISREYSGYKHLPKSDVVTFGKKAAALLGIDDPQLIDHGGGSDCNILNAKGIPTAVIGVGYEKIHTPEEFIREADLVRCAEYVRALAVTSGHCD